MYKFKFMNYFYCDTNTILNCYINSSKYTNIKLRKCYLDPNTNYRTDAEHI